MAEGDVGVGGILEFCHGFLCNESLHHRGLDGDESRGYD